MPSFSISRELIVSWILYLFMHFLNIPISMGTVVSTPIMPPGADWYSCIFSAWVCGAWSEPNMDSFPAMTAFTSASLVAASLMGGFTLYSVPMTSSAANIMWCMVTSVVKPQDAAISAVRGSVTWQMLTFIPLYLDNLRTAFSSASTGRFFRWSQLLSSLSRRIMLMEMFRKGRFPLDLLVRMGSETPASRFGMNKGKIAVGYDADFAVFDMHSTRRISADDLHSKAGHTAYEGMEAIFPDTVIVRGNIQVQDGEFCGEPVGVDYVEHT